MKQLWGFLNVNEIIELSDKILLDRGDLSREITIPSVPIAVFNILKLAQNKSEVLIATNVLDSMMVSLNLPSRAEISDIFNHLAWSFWYCSWPLKLLLVTTQ